MMLSRDTSWRHKRKNTLQSVIEEKGIFYFDEITDILDKMSVADIRQLCDSHNYVL